LLRPDRLAVLAAAVLCCLASAPSGIAGTIADYRLLVLDGGAVKWGPATFGAGATVTYAVISTAKHFDDARNCSDIVPLDGLLTANAVARTVFDGELARAFAAWSAVADITFVPGREAAADILVGAEAEPRGRAFTNVFRSPGAGSGPVAIARSVICLNPSEPWKVGFNGDLAVYDLRYALTHEIGHAIGLDHPGKPGELMDFRYREEFSSLQGGDRAGVVKLYGPRTTIASAPVEKGATVTPSVATPVAERALGQSR
jgi:hypothetical protein